jgi:hypothetical protein
MISEWGEHGIRETVESLAAEHDRGTGEIAGEPATPFAASGYSARVGEYLLLWHAGWNYVCLERVVRG